MRLSPPLVTGVTNGHEECIGLDAQPLVYRPHMRPLSRISTLTAALLGLAAASAGCNSAELDQLLATNSEIHYQGGDPESADQRTSTFYRRDYYNFPSYRTFLLSVRTSF